MAVGDRRGGRVTNARKEPEETVGKVHIQGP